MTESIGTPASKSERRRRALIVFAASVFVLALVFIGFAMFSSPDKEPAPADLGMSAAEQSDSLYDQALAALASGDATAAVGLLTEAVAKDPANEAAAKKLASLQDKSASPVSEPSATESDTPNPPADPNAGYTAAVADLAKLLPTVAAGYELSQPLTTDKDAQVSAEGLRSGSMPTVRTATFYVHDMGSIEAAASFVKNQARIAFPENGADVSVHSFDAYFGTDGDQIAVVSFSRGRFAFEVILAARSGTAPGSLLDSAVESAKSFPAAR